MQSIYRFEILFDLLQEVNEQHLIIGPLIDGLYSYSLGHRC